MKHRGKNLRLFFLSCMTCLTAAVSLNAETVVYSQGFEADSGMYAHRGVNDLWQWGTPSAAFAQGPSQAHSGSKCWGTNLSGGFSYTSDMYLTSPAIAIPALQANQIAYVRFFGWIAVNFAADRGEFLVSKDGINWETKAEMFDTMQGRWNEYSFDISDYSGGTMYLRFRCATNDQDESDPLYIRGGLYIDDIAITIANAPPIKTTLVFSGWENREAVPSCPWIYSWKDTGYEKDNDIFSTAWGPQKEYTDYYRLKNGPNVENGKYALRLVETDKEESSIDMLRLVVVDHDSAVSIAPDENGNIFTYGALQAPQYAVTGAGMDIGALIKSRDGIGYHAYHNDAVELDFGNCPISSNALFVIEATGFQVDTQAGTMTDALRPMIEIQTKESNGHWVTRNVFYPRWESAINAYDLHAVVGFDKKVRLVSRSCLTGKYNLIDFAGMSTDPQQAFTKSELRPDSARKLDGTDISGLLAYTDNNYAHTSKGENVALKFGIPPQQPNSSRHFILVSKGFYLPTGTFFFYTWDGTHWVQHDGWSITQAGNQTKTFDLSQWLPDPDGEYKVRIWQDFYYFPAGINYAGMTRNGFLGTMNYATDLMADTSILDAVKDSDGVSFDWDWDTGWPDRIRWVEINWTGFPSDNPPTTNPVSVVTLSSTSTICWTYRDPNSKPQINADVEVWTEPNGTGTNSWSPAPFSGTDTSVVYAGTPLINGRTYYARVKAYNGTSWGAWSECSFVYMQLNLPPVAHAGGPQVVVTTAGCSALVTLNGSASYDPDGDPLSYTWIGRFGTITGVQPTVNFQKGVDTVVLIVRDGNGGISQDSAIISVVDRTAPTPDIVQLPDVIGSCSATITTIPTATDNCVGKVTGTTTNPLTYSVQGTYTVTWKYSDGNGNIATQMQTVIVKDQTLPMPDVSPLPTISGTCSAIITSNPTATDNCKGKITGTTTNPLTYAVPGTYSVAWKYNDGNGNITTQTQSVVVSSGPCCAPPSDSAYNYGILANNITWSGSGNCNTGHSSIQANGQYSMSGSSTIIGNVYANSKISKSGSATIDGNASAPVISQTGSSKITGTIKIGPVAQVSVPTIDMTPYYNWAVSHGTVYNGNLHLTGSRDTVIPGGVLWVNGTFKLSGSMKFTGCVIATGSVDISGSGDFTKVNNTPVIVSVTSDISLSGSGRITGLIFAQNGKITKSGSGDVTGSLICKGDLTKSGSWSTLTYTKYLPMPPGCN